jgi:hypothetical protein
MLHHHRKMLVSIHQDAQVRRFQVIFGQLHAVSAGVMQRNPADCKGPSSKR